jgi:hypothetical protein
MSTRSLIAIAALSILGACSSSSTHVGTDGGPAPDSGTHDATVDGAQDSGTTADADATVANDAANGDAAVDASATDTGIDAAAPDATVDSGGMDAAIDSGGMDAAADSAETDSAIDAGDGCSPAPDGGHYVALAWNEVCADMVTNFTVEWGQAEGGPYPDSTDAGYSCDASACDAGGQLSCNYNLHGLDAGGWCIAVEACDNGTCSVLSGEVCVQIPPSCP